METVSYTLRKTSRACCNELPNLIKLQKECKIRLVTSCHLQTCYNLLKQSTASLWITSFDNLLATSRLTTCKGIVFNKLSQFMPTHPDIGLLVTSLLQLRTCWNLRGLLSCLNSCLILSHRFFDQKTINP